MDVTLLLRRTVAAKFGFYTSWVENNNESVQPVEFPKRHSSHSNPFNNSCDFTPQTFVHHSIEISKKLSKYELKDSLTQKIKT